MNPGVRNQIGLELIEIHIQGTIKSKWCSDRADNLANKPIKVGIAGALNVQVTTADVIDSLIVNHKCTVRVLQCSMSCQDRIVGLNHSSCHLRSRIDAELQLRLLAIVNGESFHEQRGESWSSASSKRMKDQEALQSRAVVSRLSDPIQDHINHLLADGVVAPGIVVGSIFLAGDELFGVEQLAVSSRADLVYIENVLSSKTALFQFEKHFKPRLKCDKNLKKSMQFETFVITKSWEKDFFDLTP